MIELHMHPSQFFFRLMQWIFQSNIFLVFEALQYVWQRGVVLCISIRNNEILWWLHYCSKVVTAKSAICPLFLQKFAKCGAKFN